MKIKKTITAIAVCAVLAAAAAGLSACEDNNVTAILHLDIPTDVTVVTGSDNYSNDDDYVTFTGVENAVSYQLFVWQDGDTQAKVVSGESSPISMPSDLTKGTYSVSVRAIGDMITYDMSDGSEAITYNCVTEEKEAEQLAAVSNISMDFTTEDYPTIYFTGNANASRYTVYMYEANENGNQTGTDALLSFIVPASAIDSNGNVTYQIESSVYESLNPGYFYIEVIARGDDENYLDSDSASGTAAWTGYQYEVPQISVSGNSVTVSNITSFAAGTQFVVDVYSDADCETKVASTTMTYTGSTENWGQISYNYSGNSFTVVESGTEAGEGELTAGTTYYFKAMAVGDGTIYISSAYCNAISATVEAGTASNDQNQSSGNEGGSTDASWDCSVAGNTYTFSSSDTSAAFKINDNQTLYSNFSISKQETTEDGVSYYYIGVSGDSSAPFEINSYLKLYTNGTATFYMGATGPISEYTGTGTWSETDGTITVTF